ncbi:MAG: hypothetical protein IJB86_10730 [Clostridia bacterium]|nr:hypothetical protein [Clostridia bacterium]
MNPFTVQKIIRTSETKMSVFALCKICGTHIRHGDLRLSDDMEVFDCPYSKKVCHFVKGISPMGWIKLWFR